MADFGQIDQGLDAMGLDPQELARRLFQRQNPQAMPPPVAGATVEQARAPSTMLAGRTAQAGPAPQSNGPGQTTAPPPTAAAPQGMAMPPPGPAQQRYQADETKGPPALHGWRGVLDTIGQIAAPRIEQAIPGSRGNYEERIGREAAMAKQEQAGEAGRLGMGKTIADTADLQSQTALRDAQARKADRDPAAKPENLNEEEARAVEDLVAKGVPRVDAVGQVRAAGAKSPAGRPESIDQEYSDAVSDAQSRGVDPATDPKVMQVLAAAHALKPIGAPAGNEEERAISDHLAAKGLTDTPANRDLARKELKIEDRAPAAGSTSADDIKETAHAIMDGQADPVLTNYSFRDRTAIEAELRRMGYNQAQAEMDWKATQKHLSTLNGQQQERLRQAITFTSDSLPIVENLFNEWKKNATGFKAYNRASLEVAKQMPGKAGESAHLLEAQIADLTSELGTVYKGGNSSTDESLAMAAKNLQSDWNEDTFKRAILQIRQNLAIRRNSINTSQPAGISGNSAYTPASETGASTPPAGGAPAGNDPLGIR